MPDEPKTTRELPVTVAILDEYRKENKSEHASLSIEIKSLKKEIQNVKKEFHTRCDQMENRLEAKIDSNFEKLSAIVFRTQAMMEELRNEMRYLMDSHQRLWIKVEDHDKNKMDKIDFP